MAKPKINMLEGSIWDKILAFAIPLAITSIMQQLFNAADVAIVGQFVGKHALAAVGANAIVINLLLNTFVGLTVGSNVVCANMFGARNYLRLKQAVHTSIMLGVICGIALAIFGVVLAEDILVVIDTPVEVMDDAVIYLQILMAGVPMLLVYNFGAAVLRSKGDTKRPFYAMLIAGIINVILNLTFVLGLGMSVDGVAYATVISSFASMWLMLHWLLNEEGPFQMRWKKLWLDRQALIHICKVGLPAGLQGMVFSFSNIIIQIALNNLGSEVVAASAVSLNYEFGIFFVLSSFSQAATAFVGQNYGAGNLERCHQIMRWCLGINLLVTGVFSFLICFFAYPLSGIFTSDPEVIEYSVVRIRYIISFEIINVVMETLSGGLRGVNYSLPPALCCMLGVCVLRVIYVYTWYVEHPTFEALMQVYPISWVITVIGIVAMYIIIMGRLKNRQDWLDSAAI